MYSHSITQLGQTPEGQKKSEPFYQTLLNIATKGYNIFAQRERQKAEIELAKKRAQAQILAAQRGIQPVPQSQFVPMRSQSMFGGAGDFTMPLVLAGAVGIGLLLLTRGRRK